MPRGALTRTERGIDVCAPVHGALLVEATEPDIDAVVASTAGAVRPDARSHAGHRGPARLHRGSEIHNEILHDESIAFAVGGK